MTGPEHYLKAERMLNGVGQFVMLAEDTSNAGNEPASKAALWAAESLTARAQVHAILALAAATAYQAEKDYLGDEVDCRAWVKVTT